MVVLTLTPHRGNGARSFPSTGYLGLSPVTLAGTVRTKLEEDKKPLHATSLVVRLRCYESMGSGAPNASASAAATAAAVANLPPESSSSSNVATPASFSASSTKLPATTSHAIGDVLKGNSAGKGRVLYEQAVTIWSSEDTIAPEVRAPPSNTPPLPSSCASSVQMMEDSDDQDDTGYPPKTCRRSPVKYAELGDFHKHWRIVVPPEAVRHGAKSTMIFKTWRIWWAVEAVISHKPAGIHGDRIVKSHPVTLLDHSMSPTTSILAWSSSPSPSSSSSSLSSSATRHQDRTRPPLEYRIIGPPQALGSSDPFSFDCKIRRNGNAEVPKRISIEFRRELMYSQAEAQSTPHYFEAPGVPTLPSKHSAHTLHNRSGSTPKMPHHEIPAATTHRRAQSGEVKVSQSSSRRRLSDDANSHEEGRDKKVARSSGLRDALVAPPTPPQSIPSPIEYDESSNNSGSSFGLFGPPSTTSAASASHHQRHQATPFHSSPSDSRSSTPYLFPVRSPPATAPSAPSSSFSLLPSRTATHPKRKKDDVSLAVYESDIHFSSIHPDGTAVWYGNIQGVLPKAKSLYHYALGESCCTTAARSRFYMTVRIHFKQKGHYIELPSKTIDFTTISKEERERAKGQLSRIHAIQKAEAKLFGGLPPPRDSRESSSSSISTPVDAEEGRERPSASHHGDSQRTSTPSGDSRGKTGTMINTSSAKAYPRIGQTYDQTRPATALPVVATSNPRRRRSEQLDVAESPRTRLRFGSDPPIESVSSVSVAATMGSLNPTTFPTGTGTSSTQPPPPAPLSPHSPALSASSILTTRPRRSSLRRSHHAPGSTTSLHSIGHTPTMPSSQRAFGPNGLPLRPKSSGGISTTSSTSSHGASSTFANLSLTGGTGIANSSSSLALQATLSPSQVSKNSAAADVSSSPSSSSSPNDSSEFDVDFDGADGDINNRQRSSSCENLSTPIMHQRPTGDENMRDGCGGCVPKGLFSGFTLTPPSTARPRVTGTGDDEAGETAAAAPTVMIKEENVPPKPGVPMRSTSTSQHARFATSSASSSKAFIDPDTSMPTLATPSSAASVSTSAALGPDDRRGKARPSLRQSQSAVEGSVLTLPLRSTGQALAAFSRYQHQRPATMAIQSYPHIHMGTSPLNAKNEREGQKENRMETTLSSASLSSASSSASGYASFGPLNSPTTSTSSGTTSDCPPAFQPSCSTAHTLSSPACSTPQVASTAMRLSVSASSLSRSGDKWSRVDGRVRNSLLDEGGSMSGDAAAAAAQAGPVHHAHRAAAQDGAASTQSSFFNLRRKSSSGISFSSFFRRGSRS